MKTYTYLVEQTIIVKANSKEEAERLLPVYPITRESAHYVSEETIELLREEESK